MKATIQVPSTERTRQILIVFLVTGCSLVMGSIPIIHGLSSNNSDTIVSIPSEATLWDGMVDK